MSWDKWVELLVVLSEPLEGCGEAVQGCPEVAVNQLVFTFEPDLDVPVGDFVDS